MQNAPNASQNQTSHLGTSASNSIRKLVGDQIRMETTANRMESISTNSHLLSHLSALANTTLPGCGSTNTGLPFENLPKLQTFISSYVNTVSTRLSQESFGDTYLP